MTQKLSIYKLKSYIVLLMLFGINVQATTVLTTPVTISLSNLVGNDQIHITENIELQIDVDDINVKCWIKIGAINYNANTGKAVTVDAGVDSFDVVVKFPDDCVDGINILDITGTIPSNAHNEGIYQVDFKIAITYDEPI